MSQVAPSVGLDRVFAALSDPTRRAIIARLAQGEATVNELVEPFGFSQPTISKHLKVLESAGLVARSRNAQFRPVRLNAGPLAEAAEWIGSYEGFWAESLDRLDDYVKVMQRKEKRDGQKRSRKNRRKHDDRRAGQRA
jgi:DNA-binding transcriptional ArsR family regulator